MTITSPASLPDAPYTVAGELDELRSTVKRLYAENLRHEIIIEAARHYFQHARTHGDDAGVEALHRRFGEDIADQVLDLFT